MNSLVQSTDQLTFDLTMSHNQWIRSYNNNSLTIIQRTQSFDDSITSKRTWATQTHIHV